MFEKCEEKFKRLLNQIPILFLHPMHFHIFHISAFWKNISIVLISVLNDISAMSVLEVGFQVTSTISHLHLIFESFEYHVCNFDELSIFSVIFHLLSFRFDLIHFFDISTLQN